MKKLQIAGLSAAALLLSSTVLAGDGCSIDYYGFIQEHW